MAPPSDSTCWILGGEGERAGGTIHIALPEKPGSQGAPLPTNDSERLLYHNLYETMIDVRCDGVVVPSLAESWSGPDADGLWVMNLRKGARFSDGTSLRAGDVIDSWEQTLASLSQGRELDGTTALPVDGLVFNAADEYTVAIAPGPWASQFPQLLAGDAFAVTGRRQNGELPMGSGSWKIAIEKGNDHVAGKIVCIRNRFHPVAPVGSDSLIFDFRNAGLDERDLPFDQLDMVILRDRRAVDFAADLSSFVGTPLPWDRTYLLVLPQSPNHLPLRSLLAAPGFLGSLAHDVVGNEARAIRGEMESLRELNDCSFIYERNSGKIPESRFEPGLVLFAEEDRSAAGIAARLVALARNRGDNHGAITATAMKGSEWSQFRRKKTAALICALQTPVTSICSTPNRSLQTALRIARFGGAEMPTPEIIPLVESRAHLFTRESLGGISVGAGGKVSLSHAGWLKGALLP